jgi:DNA-binding MarR family transcriptional regulator
MTTINLQDNLNWLLIRSSMIVKQRLMKLAEEYNLTLMQALTLCLIEPEQTMPMSAISELLACDASNVTGIVERLSVGSLITRRESSSDRRVKTIQLTPDGMRLRDKLLPRITEISAPGLAGLSPEESGRLKALLTKTASSPIAKPTSPL